MLGCLRIIPGLLGRLWVSRDPWVCVHRSTTRLLLCFNLPQRACDLLYFWKLGLRVATDSRVWGCSQPWLLWILKWSLRARLLLWDRSSEGRTHQYLRFQTRLSFWGCDRGLPSWWQLYFYRNGWRAGEAVAGRGLCPWPWESISDRSMASLSLYFRPSFSLWVLFWAHRSLHLRRRLAGCL